MRRRFFLLLVGALALFLVLFLAQDLLARTIFESAVEAVTGFDAAVRSLRLDLFQGEIHLKGLTLLNPYEFEERVFADVPEIYLQMDLPSLLKKEKTHVRELRLEIRELNLEKNREGVSNVSRLTSVKKSSQSVPFQLDRLELTLRRVSYHDRSSLVPKKLSVDMRVERQVFEGIRDPQSVVNLILMKLLTVESFGNLGINSAELEDQLRTSVRTARDFGEKVFTATRAEETFSQLQGTAKEKVTGLFGALRSRLESDPSRTNE